MSMTGQLYRVSTSRLEELLLSPDEIAEELYPAKHHANRELNSHTVDKAWNAIEFVLFQLEQEGHYHGQSPLTEGDETGCELHYGPVWYRSADEVKDLEKALATISRDVFASVFSVAEMNEQSVYPGSWDEENPDSEFEFVWSHFVGMLRFYEAAASSDSALLLHIG